MKLPENIEGLVKAQNDHDSDRFASYFTENANVSDEGHSYTGRDEIKDWIQAAADKYNMQMKAIGYEQTDASAVLTVEASGNFPGSPAVMHYHLGLDQALFSSLTITG